MADSFEDDDELFQFIHIRFKPKKRPFREDGSFRISKSFFKERIESDWELSVDWSRFATPEETRKRQAPEPASNYGVISHSYGKINSLDGVIETIYTPNDQNISHCDVKCQKGMDQNAIKKLAKELSEKGIWKINFDDPVKE